MDDEPVNAYEETAWEKFGRWRRAHRALAQTAIVSLISLFILGLVTTGMLIRHNNQQQLAQKSRRDNLRSLADDAARQIENQMQVRFMVLNVLANDQELQALMPDQNGDEAFVTENEADFNAMHDWLGRKFDQFGGQLKGSSIFVLSRNGIQLSRYPESRELIFGKEPRNLAHKTYFHGQNLEVHSGGEGASETRSPLNGESVSPVFFSATDEARKVAFTVPIREGANSEGTVIGLLVMTVDVGAFTPPRIQAGGSAQRRVILIDMREDWQASKEGECTGSILQHPSLSEDAIDTPTAQVPRIPNELRAEFEAQRSGWTLNQRPRIWETFDDPISHEECLAAVTPVVVDGGSPDWIIVVAEKLEAPIRAVDTEDE
jgi:hypothetical protein